MRMSEGMFQSDRMYLRQSIKSQLVKTCSKIYSRVAQSVEFLYNKNCMSTLEVVGWIAIASSQILNLSCLPSIIEIVKAKSTLQYEAEKYIASLVSAVINLLYAVAAGRKTVYTSTAISSCINGTFFLIHRHYNRDGHALVRNLLYRIIIAIGLLSLVPILAWPFTSAEELRHISMTWFGVMQMCASISVSFAQLIKLKVIIETKNAASISPPLTFGTATATFFWGIYSFMVADPFYIVGTICGVLSVSLQFYLLWKYPRILTVPNLHGPNSVSPSRVELTDKQ